MTPMPQTRCQNAVEEIGNIQSLESLSLGERLHTRRKKTKLRKQSEISSFSRQGEISYATTLLEVFDTIVRLFWTPALTVHLKRTSSLMIVASGSTTGNFEQTSVECSELTGAGRGGMVKEDTLRKPWIVVHRHYYVNKSFPEFRRTVTYIRGKTVGAFVGTYNNYYSKRVSTCDVMHCDFNKTYICRC